MAMKAKELCVELDDRAAAALSEQLKELEAKGWVFEAADASLELLMRRAAGWSHELFEVEAYRVSSYHREGPVTRDDEIEVTVEATIKLWVDGVRLAAVGEGNGPVNALDAALRAALGGRYPALERIHLTDFKVRVLDGGSATGAVVRVLIDSTDGDEVWTTVGVDTNVIEASWHALVDSLVYGLVHAEA
jgi:2-isopropylmalate synthase